jgi:hypothetical protein
VHIDSLGPLDVRVVPDKRPKGRAAKKPKD